MPVSVANSPSPVLGHDRKLVLLAGLPKSELYRFVAQAIRHFEVRDHLLRRMRHQVALRQAVEKLQQLRPALGQQGRDALDLLGAHLGVKALFIDAASEVIGGGDIKLPEIFRFPRREGFRIHRLDVGQRQQREHLQALRRFHLAGQFAHGFRIVDVAPAQGRRHLKVRGNQEADRLRVFFAQSEAIERRQRELQASVNVVVARQSLAGVVKEQRQKQQLRALQLGEQSRERLQPLYVVCSRRRCNTSIARNVCSSTV